MAFAPVIATVAETIQTAIAPVFLLAGLAGVLNVLTGRLARIVDRVRALEQLHPRSTGPEHDRHVWELRILDRRISIVNRALVLCVISAVAICLVVVGMFVAVLADLHVGRYVAVAFIVSMVSLMTGLTMFMYEVRLSLSAVRVRSELLERDRS